MSRGGGKKGMKVTTGKACDGCGRPRSQVKLHRKNIVSAGARIAMDFCLRCLRLDAEENGEPFVRPCVEQRPTVPS